ncbi:MAG TPA: hypothetical protein VED41_05640, partial [Solirubrobacteraceae bacterium]|nr:hypothetical protein [Solirubrobacteraceae bacterium]
GCHVFFSAATQTGANAYRTVGTSRVVALATTAPTLERARRRVAEIAESIPVLQWRRDIGRMSYLEGLTALVRGEDAIGARMAP